MTNVAATLSNCWRSWISTGEKLRIWEAPPQVTEPVERLVFMLHRYQNALTDS